MMEPLFGTAPSLWNVPTSLMAGWPPGGHPHGNSQSQTTGMPSPSQIRMSAEALAYGSVPLSGAIGVPAGLSGFGLAELVAPTAALVAAVAAKRGQANVPSTDAEIEDFLNDALDLLPGASDVEVRCDNGRVTLTGNVPHKRHKRDVGELAWAIPSIADVLNNVTIVARRRARAGLGRETESQPSPVRKHA